MQKIIVIVGATASQKSSLAMRLAKDLNTDIINGDSFQVYKELNVGINKPTSQDQRAIKHHLLNCASIYDQFDVKIYQTWCKKIIDELANQKKVPIICGGSNLYIDAVIKGYDLNKSDSREQITYFDGWSYDKIYNYVLTHDYDEAIKINYNNTKRIIRAAQIIYATNKPKSHSDKQMETYVYDKFIIETVLDREQLYKNINQRVDNMMNNEWVAEIQTLYIKDNNIGSLQAFNAIGYKQILASLINQTPIDVEQIKQVTRHLAKRQMTWNNNKYDSVYKFNTDTDDYQKLLSEIKEFLKNNK